MVQCCVPQCKNRSDCQNWKQTSSMFKNRKITFHSIPKNDTSRKLWIDILSLPSHISNTARICSDHFPQEAFDDTNPLRIRLKPNILPSILKIMTKEMEERLEKDSFISQPPTDKATMTRSFMEDKATMVSPEIVYNSPEKCRLRQQLQYLKEKYDKKIRRLHQIIRRRDKQVTTLKCILNEL